MTIETWNEEHKNVLVMIQREMDEYFLDKTNKTDEMVYCLNNGFIIRAMELFKVFSGKPDGMRFDRLYDYLHSVIGDEQIQLIEESEVEAIKNIAIITTCSECGARAFSNIVTEKCPGCGMSM